MPSHAEFYGIVKAGSHSLGAAGIFNDLGIELGLQINTDSVVAMSICFRWGAGKVRHLDVRELWIQERVSRGDLSIRKVHAPDNLADALTKNVPRGVLDKHFEPWSRIQESYFCGAALEFVTGLHVEWSRAAGRGYLNSNQLVEIVRGVTSHAASQLPVVRGDRR